MEISLVGFGIGIVTSHIFVPCHTSVSCHTFLYLVWTTACVFLMYRSDRYKSRGNWYTARTLISAVKFLNNGFGREKGKSKNKKYIMKSHEERNLLSIPHNLKYFT